MSSKKLNPFKDFQSDQIQRSSRKIFTAHYACRNAALNLTPVTGTTNGFIFQIINSVIESWGVRLTYFDCKIVRFVSRFRPLDVLQGIYLSSFHKVCIHILVDVRTGTTFERNGSLGYHHIIYGLKRENKKFKLKRSTVDSR